jgi:steroid 5-alpha reductase family enzyme
MLIISIPLLTAGGYWTIVSPVLLTYLRHYISGVTMLEETLRETKHGYSDNIETTNAFFPGIPRFDNARRKIMGNTLSFEQLNQRRNN